MKYKIQSIWDTKRLSVRDFTNADIPHLQEILRALHEESNWEQISLETYNAFYFENLISNPSLPPGGEAGFVHNQVITDKGNTKIIGWLEFYYGYPSTDIFWIGSLFFHPEKKGRGYGREVITEVIKLLREKRHFKSIQLGVYLRNWAALNFWFRAGFNKIIKLSGDHEFAENNNAKACLEMRL